jgi:MFS family permease
MQAAYLISSKGFSEGDIGLLFLVFGLSQFLCMAPAGYLMDYSNRKIEWVAYGSLGISAITIFGTLTAEPGGEHMLLLLSLNVLQGALTAILPSGFNAITLGIVGTKGFTHQVSRNKMMNHLGTALVCPYLTRNAVHSQNSD